MVYNRPDNLENSIKQNLLKKIGLRNVVNTPPSAAIGFDQSIRPRHYDRNKNLFYVVRQNVVFFMRFMLDVYSDKPNPLLLKHRYFNHLQIKNTTIY